MRRALAIAGITLTALAGCTANTASPHEVEALSANLKTGDSPFGIPLTKAQAKCVAQLYLESGLSDDALDAVKEGRSPIATTQEDRKALQELAGKLSAQCV